MTWGRMAAMQKGGRYKGLGQLKQAREPCRMGGSGSQAVLLKTAGTLSLERRCVEPGPWGERLPGGCEEISVGPLCRR